MQVNAVNASQIAMAGLAGVIFFGEPASWPLVAVAVLTVMAVPWFYAAPPPKSRMRPSLRRSWKKRW